MADRFPLIIDNSEEKIKELVSGDNLDLTKSNLKNADYIQSAGVNVAGVATATSLIGDGSQLTNLPPSGGSLRATASGTLADGSKVVINTDGTVSVVSQTETTGPGVGSEVVFESAHTVNISTVYDSTNQKVVIAYKDRGNSNYGTAIVGTVSGTSISFGSPVVFESANSVNISATYDSTNQKVVIAYSDAGNGYYGTAVVGTVSGTSITFGSPVIFASSYSGDISATYDSSTGKVVIAYGNYDNSNYGTAVVGTVSGTSISFGTPVVFNSGASFSIASAFDSTNGKIVIVYQDNGNSAYATAIVGTVSGTSISFGSSAVFASIQPDYPGVVYDSSNQKMVILYSDTTNSNYGTAIVGTVSGTSISFGTSVVFSGSSRANYIKSTFDSTNNKIVISYQDAGNNYYGTVVSGTVSGNSISFGTPVVFNSGNTQPPDVTFDSSNGKAVIAYQDNANSNYGTAIVFSNTGFSVPSVGSSTYTESTPSTGEWPSIAYDTTNNKVIVVYARSSGGGIAVVGTVSGTSITFGTPAEFDSSWSPHTSVVYDPINDKVVIGWSDTGSSYYGYAIVGTISGTSISFGSPTLFFNGGEVRYISLAYDSSNQKVVIAYQDYENSYVGRVRVGTVSGTSITFGTEAVFHSGQTYYPSAVYDSSNQKIVISYADGGDSNHGKSVVGTVSGTSITFGSESEFNGGTIYSLGSTYDSTNGKVVIVYRDNGNSNYGTAIVGTVSGTSISFGTESVFNSRSSAETRCVHDSTNNKIIISYRDDASPNYYGTVVIGTVSGTSISFGAPTVYNSSRSDQGSIVFDPDSGNSIILYRDYDDSQYVKTVVFSTKTMSTNLTAENYIGISNGAYSNGQTATIQIMGAVDDAQSSLTPGQAYYVQDDGTLAESGSVFAGTAIAATKLIVRG